MLTVYGIETWIDQKCRHIDEYVATVLTVYGIETYSSLLFHEPHSVATAPTVYGIETDSGERN